MRGAKVEGWHRDIEDDQRSTPATDRAPGFEDSRTGESSPRSGRRSNRERVASKKAAESLGAADLPKPTAEQPQTDELAGEAEELRKVEAKLTALFRALERKPEVAAARQRASQVAEKAEQPEAAAESSPLASGGQPEEGPQTVLHRARSVSSRKLGEAIAEISERQAFLDRFAIQGTRARSRGADRGMPLDSSDGGEPSPPVGSAAADRTSAAALPHAASVAVNALQEPDQLVRVAASPSAPVDAHRLAPTLEGRMEELAAKIDAVLAAPAAQASGAADIRPLEQMLHGLVGKVDTIQQNASDIPALREMVHQLAAKIDDARAPQATSKVLDELQSQFSTLAARIDRSDAGLTAIVSVERSLGELFSQMEETRDAAISAAESAARTAARDTLRAAMADSALPFAHGAATSESAVEQVTQEISDLRATRDAADQRMHDMMTALNRTLGNVVDRLASLEIGEDGSLSASHRHTDGGQSRSPLVLDLAETSQQAASDRSPAGRGAASLAARLNVPDAVRATSDDARLGEDEADFPIEPGEAAAGLARGLGQPKETAAPAVKADPSQFIAAARRAAQMAAQDSIGRASGSAVSRTRAGKGSAKAVASLAERATTYAASHRRPILLSLAGLVLLLGAVEVAKMSAVHPKSATLETGAVAPSATEPTQQSTDARAAPQTEPTLADGDKKPNAAATPIAPGSAVPAAGDKSASADATPAVAPKASLPTLAMGFGPNRAAAHLAPGPSSPDAAGGIGPGLRQMAQDGNAAAQYEVGLRLAEGKGVARDLKGAADWFEKAAKQGLAPAAYRLGSLYEKGLGVAHDPAMSMQWYKKAAEQGNVRAMHNLAVMSAEGADGKSDYAKAASWFTKASQMGVRDSQFNLAILYARGLGIEQNLTQSYIWFAIAAAQGDSDAAKKRDEVGRRLDAKDLATAKAAAEAFHPLSPLSTANDVEAPPGGWDAAAPTHSAAPAKAPGNPRISRM